MACIGEFAVGIATSILGKLAEYTVAPVGRQLGYLLHYTTNVSDLRTQLEHLNSARQRMQRRVNEALNNCHEIEADVRTWQDNAEQISLEANTFLNPESHARALCSCGSPHHLVTRHQLSRKAKKMSIIVRAVVSKKNEFDSVPISYPRQPEGSSATPAKGYQTFDSRSRILKNIMAAVGDGNRRRIGLHGMGGVGKTMLADEIGRRAQEEKLFSKVVKITISQTPNTKEIQQHIAEMLDITSFNQIESTSKRAELLRMRLKQEEESGILLILDDIWKELDLEAVGIHQECRMLLTSRSQRVLCNSMGIAQSNVFLIGALESSEAINLFKSIIGDTKVENNEDYKALALEIVAECGGLPISIATVAHALKCNMDSLFIWKDALQRLKNSNFTGIEEMHDKVYLSIRLSYDFLGKHEEEAKSLLLLCALHKEDEEIKVEDLIRYSMGWNLLQGVRTVSEARNRVNSLVVKLKSHSLLLDGSSKHDEVKMHDVIRDVCLTIGKEDDEHRMMNNITSVAMYERHKASKAISFVDYDDFGNLPGNLECPSLELLLLSTQSLKLIPNDFFEQTGKLKALGIIATPLTSLPLSFHLLQNLQTLCLRDSYVEDIEVIGELKNLKALDLSGCHCIKRLPKEIGELRRLQVLDLRGCDNLRVIEANVISNLTQMEELYLPDEFQGWDHTSEEGKITNERRNASLVEIKSLQRLTALYLYVPTVHVLPEGLLTEKLERYRISIGWRIHINDSKYSGYEGYSSRWLNLDLSQLDQIYASGLESVMKGSEYLSLQGFVWVNNAIHDLGVDGFRRLKQLNLRCNDGVKYIFNSRDIIQHEAFPCLESLNIEYLTSLERIICHGNQLPRGSFNELRNVNVRNCDRLKNLFPLSVAKLLHHITVYNCEMIKEIIVSHGREDDHKIEESLQLRSLHLYSLPNIVQFCCSKQTPTDESSSSSSSSSPLIDHSKPLFSETLSFSNLEELSVRSMSIKTLWPERLVSSSSSYMQTLTSLRVGRCKNLKYLFSFSLAQNFVSLTTLEVDYCEEMEDIVGVKLGEEETHMERILFPKLESLELVKLSTLQRFCAANSCVVFPLLSSLRLKECPELKTFVSSPTTIDHTEENQMLEPTQLFLLEKIAFPNLKVLVVGNCNNVKYLLPSAMTRSLLQLELLKVVECKIMEEVIVVSSVDDHECSSEGSKTTITFEKLEYLGLWSLPNIVKFYGGDRIECPLLSRLQIMECPKLKEFMGGSNIIGKEMDMVGCPKQSLFRHNKVIFPMVKELRTDWSEGIKEIFEMSNSIILFPNLLELELDCTSAGDKAAIGVPNLTLFLHKYHKIKKLQLRGPFVNLSGGDELIDTTTSTSTSLEQLCIEDADMLHYLFGVDPHENAQPSHNYRIVFPHLKYVSVQKCRRLESFAPSFMCFPNLGGLSVVGCHGLTYLFSSSTAATLVQLQQMTIENCKGIREIITNNTEYYEEEEDDEESSTTTDDCLVFQELWRLELRNLPNLQSFYSGNKVMSFPHWDQLYLSECPKMKRFSHGIINTYASLKTWVDGRRISERDDSDSALQHLFAHQIDNDDGQHNTASAKADQQSRDEASVSLELI
ncbi:disease resistance protein At4g27190-like [Cannabis sativa]|uniref:disease resistance protein At4g27190-like n=1 Tax=Cannabis sativa TaxID=3483 RepID=UPI0029CA436D|nr:disease resistance protein At4g27190-like [Cannabis sativa]